MMIEKCCVFVDGENLRFSIVDLFRGEFEKSDYLPKKADWTALFDWLVQELSNKLGKSVERLRAYWYGIDQIDFNPFVPLPKNDPIKLKKILERNEKYRKELACLKENKDKRLKEMALECEQEATRMKNRFEGWRRIQDGIAFSHKAIEFRRAGAIQYNLFTKQLGNEKAVDVKLATDMIVLRDIYDIALIVSGDQDYVPAVQVVKDFGKRVVNVAFKARNGKLLPGGARRLNQLTDMAIDISYEDIKRLLNIQ
ncbi:MAG: NYN domain-containing protein [Pirellulales bacterium]|nr:NYN domain-containing protein [Pirellulales bacterium]